MAETRVPSAARLRAQPELLDPLFERLAARVAVGVLPAAAVAIGDEEGLIRSEVYTSDPRPISKESNFFLASITKPIFATAFMQLVEEGKVGLHQPIADFEPQMGEGDKAKVTPWHLLTHTSGVTDVDPRIIGRSRPSVEKMTRIVVDSPLRFEPGSRWEYCSASFYLLGLVIERVTGMSYLRYLDERLQKPLGMHATFDPRRAGRPIVAVHGIGVDSRVRRFLVLRYMARAALPGGGLFGTLDDLMHFGAAMLRPRQVDGRILPLRPETIALMSEDQTRGIVGETEGEVRAVHFGLGWAKPTLMRDTPGSANVIAHGGVSGTRLWIDPDAGLVLVFFTNRWAADRGPEIEAVNGAYAAMGAA